MVTLTGRDEILSHAGEYLGESEWFSIDQDKVDAFADVIGDRQWIHVDVDRARETPQGTTLVHGFFTLSMESVMIEQVVKFDGVDRSLNYGVDRVRFPAPHPTGSEFRVRVTLAEATPAASGVQVTMDVEFEARGQDRPFCVARILRRLEMEPGLEDGAGDSQTKEAE